MNQATREQVVRFLRQTGLLQLYDSAKFGCMAASHAGRNAAFRRAHPGFATPPLSLCYDAYAHLNLRDYHDTGLRHAAFMAEQIKRHAPPGPLSVCEWGCGPARVLRHLPALLPGGTTFTGTDYNRDTIAWCRDNIPGIRFELNQLAPPLPCADNGFDAVFCLSVFTHLSEPMHAAWMAELRRVLRPGGLLLATLHGDYYRNHHLLPDEQGDYDAGRIVVRGGVTEGKKWFAAFHSPAFVRKEMMRGWDVVDHQPSPLPGSIEQDLWIARKPTA